MRGSIVLRVLSILVLVAILVGGGYWAFNAGLSQGYAQGLAASGSGVTTPQVPAAPGAYPYYPGYGRWGWGPHFFFPFFPLFWVFGLFLVFFVIGGIFRRAWWGRHYYGPHGPYGPYGPYGPHPEPGQQPQPGQPEGEKPSEKQ